MNYQIDVKYDKRVMQCSINNENIEFVIKGQSMSKNIFFSSYISSLS